MSSPKKKKDEVSEFICKADNETDSFIDATRPVEDEIAARLKAYMLKVYEQRLEKEKEEGKKEDGKISDV